MSTAKKMFLAAGLIVASAAYVVWLRATGSPTTPPSPTDTTNTQTSVPSETINTPTQLDDDEQPIVTQPTPTPITKPTPTPTRAAYKDGTYTGAVAQVIYGPVQVKVTIAGGKITAIDALQYPNDREESIKISNKSLPILKQEAITIQSSAVHSVSGATETSQGFVETLQSALAQAKA